MKKKIFCYCFYLFFFCFLSKQRLMSDYELNKRTEEIIRQENSSNYGWSSFMIKARATGSYFGLNKYVIHFLPTLGWLYIANKINPLLGKKFDFFNPGKKGLGLFVMDILVPIFLGILTPSNEAHISYLFSKTSPFERLINNPTDNYEEIFERLSRNNSQEDTEKIMNALIKKTRTKL